jgi:ribose-phosphate pyrophosphokinase
MENVKIVAGSSSYEISYKICSHLDIELTNIEISKFLNQEIKIQLLEQVRNKDVFIINTGVGTENSTINDIIIETLLIIDCCKRSNAKNITLIIPHFPYSRQERKDNRSPISCSSICRMFENAGVDRMISLDLHNGATQAMFYGPFDNLYTTNIIKNYLLENYFEDDFVDKFTLCSPDVGAAARLRDLSKKLKNMPMIICNKTRDYTQKNTVESIQVICDKEKYVKDKIIILNDDLLDSGGTALKCCDALIERGAKKVIIFITHALLNGNAIKNINQNPNVEKIITTNSVPQAKHLELCHKLEVLDLSPLFAEVIKRLINGDSISKLFE